MVPEQQTAGTSGAPPGADRSIGDLLRELYREFATMVDRQIALAKHEAAAAVRSAGTGLAVLTAGGLLALVGFIYLVLAAVYGLARVLPPWAAAGLVGLVLLAAGGIVARVGLGRLSAAARPLPETRESVREGQAWAQQEAGALRDEIRGERVRRSS